MTEREQKLADAQIEQVIDNLLYEQGMRDYDAGVWTVPEDMAYVQGHADAEYQDRCPTKPTPDEELPV